MALGVRVGHRVEKGQGVEGVALAVSRVDDVGRDAWGIIRIHFMTGQKQ
jgi:hypothetical protein